MPIVSVDPRGPIPVPLRLLASLAWRIRRRQSSAFALIALALGFAALAVLGWSSRGGTESLAVRAGGWVFWSLTVTALVASYTSFEVLFRAPVLSSAGTLPVSARRIMAVRLGDMVIAHTPLLLVPVATGAGFVADGHYGLYALGLGAALIGFLAGLGVASGIHLATGRSLVTGASPLKAYLAQGLGPPEAALLFYGPAAVLIVWLALIVVLELGVRTWLLRSDAGPLLWGCGIGLAVALHGLRSALKAAASDGHAIAARFREAEILPAWREDGAPPRLFGEGIEPWLPAASRPPFRRHLRQMRRRFRVVPLLMALSVGVLLLTPRLSSSPMVATTLAAALLAALWLDPTTRALGGELGRPLRARALPVDLRAERTALLALICLEQWPLVVAAGLGVSLSSGALVGVETAAVVLVLLVLLAWITTTTLVRQPGHVERAAWGIRTVLAAVVVVIAVGGWL